MLKQATGPHPVTRHDGAAEDSAKGIEGAAVPLWKELCDVDDQGASRIGGLHELHDLSVLRASVASLHLRHEQSVNADASSCAAFTSVCKIREKLTNA